MSERRTRARILLTDNFELVILALLVVAGIGAFVTYTTHIEPGTTTEERQVSSWESTGEFFHRATVQNDTEVYAQGTVLHNQSVYFQQLTPELDGVFAYEYTASDGGNLSVETDITLRLRSVQADTEGGLYFAVGYVHAADRLFQMDLFRRRMSGTLAAAVGEQGVDSDLFYTSMDVRGAAEANWEVVRDTPTGDALEAYAAGVEAYRTNEGLPLEFGLLGYEPEPWTPVASMLIEKQLAWGLTGNFRALRRATVADDLGEAVAQSLGIPYDVIEIEPIAEQFDKAFPEGVDDRTAAGNVRVRTRAVLNYYVANVENRIVLGTGNRSEAMTGYFTKYGDQAVDCNPIGDLYKQQVRQLAAHVGVPHELVMQTPTAEMWAGQTDEEEMGLNYDHLDAVLALHIDGPLSTAATVRYVDGVTEAHVERVEELVEGSAHKRSMPPAPGLSVRE